MLRKKRNTYNNEPRVKQKILRAVIHIVAWTGIAVIFYIGFSFFFDTPLEYQMKRSTEQLSEQYRALSSRYDSVRNVLDNVVDRDRNVFATLFEAEPYNFEGDYETSRLQKYEKLLDRNLKELVAEYNVKARGIESKLTQLTDSYDALWNKAISSGDDINYIPSIQPVINNELTLLTASYGLRIHPFYKTLAYHQGVDYTVPEGSRVFATADGKIKEVIERRTSSGLTVVITHGNGYETHYSHLSRINVKKGQSVKRGDIIALSGNTGLSLAPHLHYEIRYNGMRVDPIHYFFMELNADQYQKIIMIARSGMQSFD